MGKGNMRGFWSPNIAPNVQVGRCLLAVLFTGNKKCTQENGEGHFHKKAVVEVCHGRASLWERQRVVVSEDI